MTIKPEKIVWNKSWGKQSEIVKISAADRKFFKHLFNEVNPKDKEVLELGCGRAALSYLLSEYGPESITLVDFSKEALLRAKNIFNNSKNIEFIEDDLLKFETKKKYDIVFSSGVVEHFSNELRELAIDKHFYTSKDKVIFLVPAKPHYNSLRHRKRRTIESFGWQKAFSRNEMNNYCRKHTNFNIIVSKRFYSMYGITLFELLSLDSNNRIIDIYNTIVKYIDKVFIKLKLYLFLNFLLTPFENMIGGVLIIIAQKNKN
tara:strand:- start:1802 stop:2581 length:780 start_codon:yes stop_codon:yes gene_type:complete